MTSWITFAILFCLSLSAPVEEDLVASIVIIGSGGRSPLRKYEELSTKEHIEWKDGYGQITPTGLRQMNLLGKYIKRIYIEDAKYLNKTLNLSEISCRSLNEDRNLMAAQSFALGLYPDGAQYLTYKELMNSSLWLPPFPLTIPEYVTDDLLNSAVPFDIPFVPITAYDKSSEQVLSFTSCGAFKNMWTTVFKSKEMNAIIAKYDNDINELCDKYQVNCTIAKKDDNIFYFSDFLLSSEFELKTIIEDNLLSSLKSLQYEIVKQTFIGIKPLVFCGLETVIGEYFNKTMRQNNTEKMMVLATDEFNIFGYLFAAGFNETIIKKEISFGSILELRLLKFDNTYLVSMVLNGDTLGNPMELDEFLRKIKADKDCKKNCKLQ